MDDAYARARHLIDRAHAADPAGDELAYADAVERWLERVVDQPAPLLRLAARCQHLERWTLPRDRFPMDRTGYLTWRKTLYGLQADRARALLLEAGVAPTEAEDARTWVAKTALSTNAGSQALEDAACLVFLEREIGGFAESHAGYSRDKYLDILRKTWRKMSPRARELALGIPQSEAIAALIQEAISA